jgi:GLPGLI family protein
MKKTINLSIVLFIIFISGGYSQLFTVYPEKEIGKAEIIATYVKTFQLDSLDPRKRKENMTLMIGEKSSWFFSEAHYAFIKASQQFTSMAEFQSFVSNPAAGFRNPAFRYMIYKNFPEGRITTTDHIPSDHYLYTENLHLFDWKITDEIIQILGYKAQKATTFFAGRNWIAWFTTQIAYNEGPYKFNGLPGLILKVHDTKNHYLFELVTIEIPKESTTLNFTERQYIKTTKEGFFRAWHSFRYDFIARSRQYGLDSHTGNVMGENLHRHNNFIELKFD